MASDPHRTPPPPHPTRGRKRDRSPPNSRRRWRSGSYVQGGEQRWGRRREDYENYSPPRARSRSQWTRYDRGQRRWRSRSERGDDRGVSRKRRRGNDRDDSDGGRRRGGGRGGGQGGGGQAERRRDERDERDERGERDKRGKRSDWKESARDGSGGSWQAQQGQQVGSSPGGRSGGRSDGGKRGGLVSRPLLKRHDDSRNGHHRHRDRRHHNRERRRRGGRRKQERQAKKKLDEEENGYQNQQSGSEEDDAGQSDEEASRTHISLQAGDKLGNNKYHVVERIGCGTFGKVFSCRHVVRGAGKKKAKSAKDAAADGASSTTTTNNSSASAISKSASPVPPTSSLLMPPALPLVAVKIVRRVKRYIESAVEEASIMKKINTFMDDHDGDGSKYMVRLLDTFYQKSGHYCMVLDRCGPSLYDLVKQHKYVPLHVDTILSIGQQLMSSLAFLHDVCHCVHTDLKLENILFSDVNIEHVMDPHQGGSGSNGFSSGRSSGRSSSSSSSSSSGRSSATTATSMYVRNPRIRLIDFGGATFETDHHASIINTRQYRGPEVILNSGWSYPSDVWSAGCILFELAKGRLLFETHDNHEHLALMAEMLGPFPPALAHQHWQKNGREKFFESIVDRSGREYLKLIWPGPHCDRESVEHVSRMLPLSHLCAKYHTGQTLSNVLHRVLRMNPSERSTARQIVEQLHSCLTTCKRCGTKEKSMTRCEMCRKYFVCIGCSSVVGACCGCNQ